MTETGGDPGQETDNPGANTSDFFSVHNRMLASASESTL